VNNTAYSEPWYHCSAWDSPAPAPAPAPAPEPEAWAYTNYSRSTDNCYFSTYSSRWYYNIQEENLMVS
jgi:hypothetical protein